MEEKKNNLKENNNLEYEVNEEESSSLDWKKRLETIKRELDNCRKEKDEYLLGWQRAKADFINYKRDEEKRLKELKLFSLAKFLQKILPVLDDLELALIHIPNDFKKDEWTRGLFHIREKLKTILNGEGIEEIKTVGEKFNPEFHEAVEIDESKAEEGMITEEIQKGYTIDRKVIRPARVKVSK